jgi:hypothetical protein
MRGISWLTDYRLASLKGLCFMELVILFYFILFYFKNSPTERPQKQSISKEPVTPHRLSAKHAHAY